MSLKILLVSNAGWAPSGYGTQIQSLAPRLRDAGHEIAVSAFFGLQGGQINWEGIHHYPSGYKPYGNDVIPLHARHFGADVVVTLIDVWVLRPEFHTMFRFVPWTPIDHQPVPAAVLERLRNAWAVMAYSHFAMEELARVGIRAHYIPHGVELDVFKPMPETKEKTRLAYGIDPEKFVVGMVAANQERTFPTRKGFELIIPAVAQLVHQEGLDDIVLYMHTLPTLDMGGCPIIELVKMFGMEQHIYFPRPDTFPMGGLSRPEMASLYNAFDVYACPSAAEGFGLPLVEAQACGVPVIATDFSACKELCTSGWTIDVLTMVLTPMLSYRALPSIQSLKDRIRYAYENRDELAVKGEEAAAFAQDYSWDTIVQEQWIPTLNEFESRIGEQMTSKNVILPMDMVK